MKKSDNSKSQSSMDRPLTLDQFLKSVGVVTSGGQAKIAIQDGYVTVNGALETRRGRKMSPGDVVVVDGKHQFTVPTMPSNSTFN